MSKFLTYEERLSLQKYLKESRSFKEISRRLEKNPTTISREVNKRKKLNDRSPYETFSFYHGEEMLQKLGCSPVAAKEILMKPTLLKR